MAQSLAVAAVFGKLLALGSYLPPIAIMSFEELTPAQVKELLCKHITQQRMITVQELNVFGVGGDVLEEAKHHVPFLLALIS